MYGSEREFKMVEIKKMGGTTTGHAAAARDANIPDMTHSTTRRRSPHLAALAIACLLSPPALLAQQANFDDAKIVTIDVADGIYMLAGIGGNIGLSVGDDGAFIIDDQFGQLTDKIVAAVEEKTDKPIEFVFNTHWHNGSKLGVNWPRKRLL